MDFMKDLIQNPPLWLNVTIITLMLTVFSRVIIKIYNMGMQARVKLVTKEEQNAFEAEIRKDMRGYASQIQKNVLDVTDRTLSTKLQQIDKFLEAAEKMKESEMRMSLMMESFNQKYDELQSLKDTVNRTANKVSYLENFKRNGNERRTDKDIHDA